MPLRFCPKLIRFSLYFIREFKRKHIKNYLEWLDRYVGDTYKEAYIAEDKTKKKNCKCCTTNYLKKFLKWRRVVFWALKEYN